ncbi:MAG: molybdopterin converting factor subunit 1 [Alphaproteobacteria bacterium]|jgi:molybdopterin synthase sulfur carrier subunit|nr:molybdopterin converting factor subunit 1 [Alphaproteobacteria bacterium]
MRIRYFAWLRHRVGTADEEIELPAEVTTVGALGDWLAARSPGFKEAWQTPGVVRVAVNQTHVTDTAAAVKTGDEVAFFPPVTGG